MDLYKRIDELCKSKKLSIPQMCNKAQIRSSIIYDLKSGKKENISRKTAEKISAALDISVSVLYDEKTPEAGASREQKYETIFNLLGGMSVENAELALKGLQYLVTMPDDKLPEAVRYLQFLANSAEN